MRSPKSLETLAEHGVIQEVLRPLMSGKEAQIYLVVANDRVCAAKIYKESQNRSFKHRTDYMEGRKVRNSRDQRAMAKGSAYGKSKDEEAWRTTEVDMIYRLRAAGVRVPEPYLFLDGVLLMELVCDEHGDPAPRLGDVSFTPQECTQIFHIVLQEVVRMLCAGIVHGDLSDFNVLLGRDGPVLIDFPQSVEAAGNLNARRLLLRDVDNLHRFLARFVPGARRLPYGEEIWSLYENNQLTPETRLTGRFKHSSGRVDTKDVLGLIQEAARDEMRRRALTNGEHGRISVPSGRAAPPLQRRREVIVEKPAVRSSRGRQGPPGDSPRASGGSAPLDASRPGGRRPHGGPVGARPPKPANRKANAAPAPVYVSPEARKTKVLKLTPRAPAESATTTKTGPPPQRRTPPEHSRRDRGASRGLSERPVSPPRKPAEGSALSEDERRSRARARRDERKKLPTKSSDRALALDSPPRGRRRS